ncbi:hypothetical protein HGA91_05690 [candidate division WWE3 bacterium]|nr:hypothetical protein [candidate division WWE3 bacterium]
MSQARLPWEWPKWMSLTDVGCQLLLAQLLFDVAPVGPRTPDERTESLDRQLTAAAEKYGFTHKRRAWYERAAEKLTQLFNRLDNLFPALIPMEIRNQAAASQYTWLYDQGLITHAELLAIKVRFGDLWEFTGD